MRDDDREQREQYRHELYEMEREARAGDIDALARWQINAAMDAHHRALLTCGGDRRDEMATARGYFKLANQTRVGAADEKIRQMWDLMQRRLAAETAASRIM